MDTLRGNLDKVVQHGKRANAVVKNMLLHSREALETRNSSMSMQLSRRALTWPITSSLRSRASISSLKNRLIPMPAKPTSFRRTLPGFCSI